MKRNRECGARANLSIVEAKLIIGVDRLVAADARHVERAAAIMAADRLIDASGGKRTRQRGARVDAKLAMFAAPIRCANATKARRRVDAAAAALAYTRCAILANAARTRVRRILATAAAKSVTTSAFHSRAEITANTRIFARLANATIGRAFAIFAYKRPIVFCLFLKYFNFKCSPLTPSGHTQ